MDSHHPAYGCLLLDLVSRARLEVNCGDTVPVAEILGQFFHVNQKPAAKIVVSCVRHDGVFGMLFVKNGRQHVEFRRLLVTPFHEPPRLLAFGFRYNRLQARKLASVEFSEIEASIVFGTMASFEQRTEALHVFGLGSRAFPKLEWHQFGLSL